MFLADGPEPLPLLLLSPADLANFMVLANVRGTKSILLR